LKSENPPNIQAQSPTFSRWLQFGGAGIACQMVFLWLLFGASLGVCTTQEAPATANPTNDSRAPFLRFRDATLDYTGPERDQVEPPDLKEVKIGWFGPHDSTNPSAADLWWAANLAIQEANEQGGFKGLPFRLVPRWSVDPWGTGVSQLTRMIYNDEPVAVLGSVDSPSTHLAEQVVAKAQLTLVSPIATDKSVTLAGISWMFACAPTDDAIARVLVADLLATLKGTSQKLILLSATDHESRMTAREVLRELSRRERPPDFRFEFPSGATSNTSQMAAIDRIHPAAVLIVAGTEDSARLVMAVREHAPPAVIFGMHAMGRSRFLQLAGRAAEGVRFPVLFVPDMSDPTTAVFLQHFKSQHPYPPDYTAAFAYDATRLLLEAIRRAGINRVRVREALGQLSPWPGIAGSIHFDGTGQNTRTNLGMGQIREGAMVPLTTGEKSRQPTTKPL
jgi:branched-chain amino acid transport system substrate-binding protein